MIRIHTRAPRARVRGARSYIWIYQFDEAGIRRVEYEDTEHYRVYRDFLENRAASLRILLDEEV